jgi:hypothetical protein
LDKRDALVLIGILAGTGTAVSMMAMLAMGIIDNPFLN